MIKVASREDEPFLCEMLYEALFVPPGDEPFPRSVLRDPSIRQYFEGFGRESSDCGLVSTVGEERVGAAWARLIHGYGYVDDETPELTVAVVADFRGRGIGTALVEQLAAIQPRLSLSTDVRNPAMRMYRRLGFRTVTQDGTSATMLRRPD